MLTCLLDVPAASAQYFGVNKVQYATPPSHVLETTHFDVYFEDGSQEAAQIAGRMAERWRDRLSRFFGEELRGRQPLVLYSSRVTFEQTLIVPSLIDSGTAGLTEPLRRRIVMPMGAGLAETDHVLGHELVHAFQFSALASTRRSQPNRRAPALPLWFIEGLAEYASIGAVDAHTAMWLRDAVGRDDLPTLTGLGDPRRFPYRWGHAFWAYLGQQWGDDLAAAFFKSAISVGIPAALKRVLGIGVDEFVATWHEAMREEYQPSREAVSPGVPVVGARPFGGSLNVGPAVSPDGQWIAFFSERDYFSVDVFVADARTGTVVRQLTNMASSPHYSSLQFTGVAGAWDAQSRRVALSTVNEGAATISIFSWPDGRKQADLVVRDVDEIHTQTWSPDGQFIAFSAMSHGFTDLYIYSLADRSLRRLTSDTFADLQPAWSPDSRRIAFVTDRFTSTPEELLFGDYRLAVLDVESGSIAPLPAIDTGKQISPQWSADGTALYFLSDTDGTSNLYRLDPSSGMVERLSNVGTGVSGVTAASPAVSVAAGAGTVAFTVFHEGRFSIHRLEGERRVPILAVTASTLQASLPPAMPAQPLPTVSPYRPRLKLERIVDASLSAGVSRVGAAAGGGLAMVFSDILNTHRLITAAQFNQGVSIRDAAIYGAYINQARRWNWGVVGSVIPSYLGVRWALDDSLFAALLGPIELVRQTERAGSVVATYAFDRARRVELEGGVSRLVFDRYREPKQWTSAASSLTLGTATVAYVHDETSHGATSVVRGHRYRLEAAPTLGTIGLVRVLADYRRYINPAPFYTIAARGMHTARYGSGSADPRIPPMYLGNPTLVRGYPLAARFAHQCIVPLSSGCPEIDDLVGTGVTVGNLELRFPLLRPFGVSRNMYGPIPVELAFFVDGGVVKRRDPVRPDFHGLWSTGVSVRTSLFGVGGGQLDIARPFRNGSSHWVVQFNIVPAL